MAFIEKYTWAGKELIVRRDTSPVKVAGVESQQVRLEKLDVNDPKLRPSNYDKAEGTPLPILQAEGVRVDLSKRTKEPMTFWHRNMECDEIIFCYKGSIHWETELGNITLRSGEMFVIPKGIAHRSLPPADSQEENIIVELKVRGDVSKLV